jgi:hypothetical protein
MATGASDIYDPSGTGAPLQQIPLDWSWLMGLTGGLYDPQFDPSSPSFIGSAGGGMLNNPYGGTTSPGPTTPQMGPPILQPPPPMMPPPPPTFGSPNFIPQGGVSGSGGGNAGARGVGGGGSYSGEGGFADKAKDAVGGIGMARGGMIPGAPNGAVDDVPINADQGEFVVRQEAARLLGPEALAAINNPTLAPKIGMAIQKLLGGKKGR